MQKGFVPVLILVGILVIVAVAGGAYFLGKSSIPKTSQSSQSTRQSTVTPQPSLVPDETATWKTYINSKYNYSIKYPQDFSALENSPDYVRFSQGQSDPNAPSSQTYLSIQFDNSSVSEKLQGVSYKTSPDGKTLRIVQLMMDIDDSQKSAVQKVFGQILSTFKFTN